MTLVYLAVFALFLLALLVVFAPLRGAPKPFPENPRPEELKVELEALKREAKELSGPERVRVLKRIAWIERELGAAVAKEEARAARPATRVPVWAWALVVAGGLGLAAALVHYTLPRLPGGAVTESLAIKEAKKLKELRAKAEKENTPEAWLEYADYAYRLHDLERAFEGYNKVIELDHKNIKAYRRIGILLYLAGRPQDAAEVLRVVTRVDPDPEGLLFLGNAYFQLGRYQDAIEAWQEYLNRGGEDRKRVEELIATARARLETDNLGEIVYAEKCASCHGAKGEGGIGPKLAGNPILNAPEAVAEIVRNGRGTMPAIPLSDEEMTALIAYLKQL